MATQEKQEGFEVVQSYFGFVFNMKKEEIEILASIAAGPAIFMAFTVMLVAIFALTFGCYVIWAVLL